MQVVEYRIWDISVDSVFTHPKAGGPSEERGIDARVIYVGAEESLCCLGHSSKQLVNCPSKMAINERHNLKAGL